MCICVCLYAFIKYFGILCIHLFVLLWLVLCICLLDFDDSTVFFSAVVENTVGYGYGFDSYFVGV